MGIAAKVAREVSVAGAGFFGECWHYRPLPPAGRVAGVFLGVSFGISESVAKAFTMSRIAGKCDGTAKISSVG